MTPKLGRCECAQFHGKECHDGHRHCQRSAVRMVTVLQDDVLVDGGKVHITPNFHEEDIPMCAACADWHEKGGK